MKQTSVEAFNRIPGAVLDNIIKTFHRAGCPLMMGAISAEIGWSLERTEMMLEQLIVRGLIRKANKEELLRLGLSSDANLFVLTGSPSLALAAW